MSDSIVQLAADDFEEAMDFLNLVFGAYRPHDFANMIPAVYRPTDEHMGCNHAIRQDGRIRAIVGMYPIMLHIGDTAVKVAGVGAVSTHPSYRGRGYMKALMHHCIEQMKAQGYHLSWLSGRRQRYLHFGYELCGMVCAFTVSRVGLTHCFDGSPDLRFEPIGPGDAACIATAGAIHDTQPVHCARPSSDFYRYLTGWHHRPFAALDEAGRMAGYLVTNEPPDLLAELCATTGDAAIRMVRAWVDSHSTGSATFKSPPVADDLFYELTRISDRVRIEDAGNWRVFDWITVTDALMKLRRRNGPMADGTVVVGIDGYGSIRLHADGEEAGCAATDERPDVTCDAPTAMRLLFGPLPPALSMPFPARAAALEFWCPLPLSFPRQDWV